MDNLEKLATLGTQYTGQRQTKKQHRKLKDEQHELHQKLGMNPCACEGLSVPASYKTIAT